MTMLKQSPSKNLRSKGYKVKNVLQICVLLVVCVWFLHQVKNSYEEKKAIHEEDDTAAFSEVESEHESVKLGRKDLQVQRQQSDLEKDGRRGAGGELVENKAGESEDGGRGGGGDDEIDGHDGEKPEDEESEEVEDLIDEEDREDVSEEQEIEEMGNQIEEESLLENQARYEGERHSEASEERYEGTSGENRKHRIRDGELTEPGRTE